MTGERDRTNGLPAAFGQRLLAVHAALTVLVVATLLLPLSDLTQRIVAGVLLALFLGLALGVGLRWGWNRRLRPRLLRWADLVVGFWGMFTALTFLFLSNTARESVVGGLLTAAIFGVIMWFVDRDRRDSSVRA